MKVRAVGSISEVPREAWDALDHGPSPFMRHGFLRALEDSKSIGGKSGWTPVYLLAERGAELLGAVAAFIKSHSYGEYIFDWGWANAAQRAGLQYYPKLVVAAPQTPATGNRILSRDPKVRPLLMAAVRALADEAKCSSAHWLFCTQAEQDELEQHGFFPRATFQYHWKNRDYASFDAFLAALKSRKRKQLRKEHERAKAQIERLTWVEGEALTREQLDDMDRFYRNTTDEHGGRDYLRPGFFHRLKETLPDAMRVVEVIAGGKRVAGALFFETAQALYGRYWGADVRVDLLHFETAYYAGIERAIAQKIPLFEAGAQGEHKLVRGFEPSPTYSSHWIRHQGLANAVAEHCEYERVQIEAELAELAKMGPYRSEGEKEEDA